MHNTTQSQVWYWAGRLLNLAPGTHLQRPPSAVESPPLVTSLWVKPSIPELEERIQVLRDINCFLDGLDEPGDPPVPSRNARQWHSSNHGIATADTTMQPFCTKMPHKTKLIS